MAIDYNLPNNPYLGPNLGIGLAYGSGQNFAYPTRDARGALGGARGMNVPAPTPTTPQTVPQLQPYANAPRGGSTLSPGAGGTRGTNVPAAPVPAPAPTTPVAGARGTNVPAAPVTTPAAPAGVRGGNTLSPGAVPATPAAAPGLAAAPNAPIAAYGTPNAQVAAGSLLDIGSGVFYNTQNGLYQSADGSIVGQNPGAVLQYTNPGQFMASGGQFAASDAALPGWLLAQIGNVPGSPTAILTQRASDILKWGQPAPKGYGPSGEFVQGQSGPAYPDPGGFVSLLTAPGVLQAPGPAPQEGTVYGMNSPAPNTDITGAITPMPNDMGSTRALLEALGVNPATMNNPAPTNLQSYSLFGPGASVPTSPGIAAPDTSALGGNPFGLSGLTGDQSTQFMNMLMQLLGLSGFYNDLSGLFGTNPQVAASGATAPGGALNSYLALYPMMP